MKLVDRRLSSARRGEINSTDQGPRARKEIPLDIDSMGNLRGAHKKGIDHCIQFERTVTEFGMAAAVGNDLRLL